MKKIFFTVIIMIFSPALASAELSKIRLTLSEVESATIESSPKIKMAQHDYEGALTRSYVQQGMFSPKLSLEASYRYQSVVPEFSPIPNGPKTKFGDNPNYSFGPQVSWTAFASGNLKQRWKASQATARAAYNTWDSLRRQSQLEARLAYFRVCLGLEQIRLLADALKLEESQYRDIHLKYQAGAVSRIDELSAHQQVLNRRRELRQSQADLAGSLHSLSDTSGLLTKENMSVPLEASVASRIPAELDAPTFVLESDPWATLAKSLNVESPRVFDDAHPNLLTLSESIDSAKHSAQALRSGYGPTIQVTGKLSRDYPNGPVLESFNQKTIGVAASWPLFEGKKTPNEVNSQMSQMKSLEEKRIQSARDLRKEFETAHDQLAGLRTQDKINQTAIDENETLAKLVYDAYRAGRSTYLEVENANLRLLQARVVSARTRVEILIQVAVLDSLAKPQK